MRTLIFVLTFISPPFFKKVLLKWFCGASIGRNVYVGWFSAVMGRHIELGDFSEIRALSIIKCEGDVKIGAYSVISNMVLVYGASGLTLGERCYVGPQCLINVDRDVRFGNVSAIGPRSMIFTHGSFLPYTEGYWVKFDGVTIGDYVWIAAGVFIQPGVTIGNNVFVNSRSVLTHEVAEGDVVSGNPAQSIGSMQKLKRAMKPGRVDVASKQILRHFSEEVLQKKMKLEVNEDENSTSFRYRGREYLLSLVPSNDKDALNGEFDDKKRCIFLVNRPNWLPPGKLKDRLIFDLTTMSTDKSRDKIHVELWEFMRMYFGVTFKFK